MYEPAQPLPRSLAFDRARLQRLFGTDEILPLWIAEPYLPLAPPIQAALENRAQLGWYGYESRPPSVKATFWEWMTRRHGWDALYYRRSESRIPAQIFVLQPS